ncbi:TSUP family transporter [Taibaiella koreensis]|uniref:TSUP family transporter n=1 Tax=Taibaiella koreensis TaxID=1268548 RepID=UPI000E59D21B|nr:TSUP family transporter [Taibaiella koreensis]
MKEQSLIAHKPGVSDSADAAPPENRLFPIFLKAEALPLLIIGAGNIGYEKLCAVLANAPDAAIRVVAGSIGAAVQQMAALHPNVQLEESLFVPGVLDGARWVIAATGDPEADRQIREAARERNLLLNVADVPELCDFYLGAVVRKGNLKIGISTNGLSPTIAKRLKNTLQETLPEELDQVLLQMQAIRQYLSGDFSGKVKKLNAITSILAREPSRIRMVTAEQQWKWIAYRCIFAFFFMVAGYVVIPFFPIKEMWHYGLQTVQGWNTTFYLMILAGFLAQLVDGALGMGYGVTCTAVLLSIGTPLPAISGSIHAAEMFSSGASGLSHYKFGNVNKKLFLLLLLPGVAGAIAGALLLSWLGDSYAAYIKPVLAGYTLLLGVRILVNAFRKARNRKKLKRVGWLAAAGGFLDSFGGGGWGPLVTSTLIAKGKTPRYVIGTVSITEFFVTFSSALTFFAMIGISHLQVIIGLIIGGVAAAPLAAKLSGRLPVKTMFIAVGTLVILWSLNILLRLLLG